MAFAIAFGLLGVSVVGGGPLPIDVSIRSALGVGGPIQPVLQLLNDVGGAVSWDIGVAILAAILFVAGRRLESVWFAGGVLLGEAIATGAKLLVDRQRPPGIAVQDLVTQASFPSGHVTRLVVTAGLLLVLLAHGHNRGRWGWIGGIVAAALLTILIGLARIASGEHWPTDVLGGYLLSGAIVAGIAAIPIRLRASGPGRPRRKPLAPPGSGQRP